MSPLGVGSWCGRSRLQQLLALAAGGTILLLMAHDVLRLTSNDGAAVEELDTTTAESPCGFTDGCLDGRPISGLWDERRPEQAWFSDPQCRPLVTRFARDRSLPLVFLASFPGSDDTRLRWMLEMTSGLFTSGSGPTYRSVSQRGVKLTDSDILQTSKSGRNELVDLGFKGEEIPGQQGITVIFGTHLMPEPLSREDAEGSTQPLATFPQGAPRKAALVVHDPFKVLVSFRKLVKTGPELGEDRPELYQGPEWEEFVAHFSQEWYNMNTQWVLSTNATMLVGYERLNMVPIQVVTDLLRFLGIQPDDQRMECFQSQLGKEKHEDEVLVMPLHRMFPPELRADVWTHVHMLNMFLKKRGKGALPMSQFSFAKDFASIYKELLKGRS